jgi:uncharacterized hydrophobic protein (TIGR00271 family)
METTQPKKTGLDIAPEDQYRTVAELLEKSQPDESFYVMLALSSVIIAGGILINNIAVVIGGMLVTPLLTPILVIALGLTTGEKNLIERTIKFLGKSMLAIVAGSFVLGVLFGADVEFPATINTMSGTFLYFVIAVASGLAVTYAWIRKEQTGVLPGIAIAVSLVPPLSYVGVGVAKGAFATAVSFAIIFLLNFIGIVLGSLLVFSLSQFNRVHKHVEKVAEEIVHKKEEEAHEKALEA